MDLNANHRTDAEHIRKKNIEKNVWPNTRGGGAGVPDGTTSCTPYTKT